MFSYFFVGRPDPWPPNDYVSFCGGQGSGRPAIGSINRTF